MGLQIQELASFQSVQCCSQTISPIFHCFSAYTAESTILPYQLAVCICPSIHLAGPQGTHLYTQCRVSRLPDSSILYPVKGLC